MPLPVCACSPVTRTRGALGQCDQLIRLGQGHAEFGVHAAGAHMLVMSAAESRIDAQEDLSAAKHLRPHFERIKIVQGDPHALGEANSYSARGAKFGVNSTRSGSRPGTERKCVLEFAPRHALQGQTRGVHAAQDLRMPIRLHRIRPALHRAARAAPRRWRHPESRRHRQRPPTRAPRCRSARRRLLRLLPPIQRLRGGAFFSANSCGQVGPSTLSEPML